jgi:glucokinase
VTESPVPVLEVGGTHVTAGLVDTSTWRLLAPGHRVSVDPTGSASSIVDSFVTAATLIPALSGVAWGVAMPDPFDYERGVGLFHGVAKFESLNGVDVGAALRAGITAAPSRVDFVNDADSFILGEWVSGAAIGARRCAGITLGTGVGSGWIADGRIVSAGPDVPPGGRAHRITIDGLPLEDVMSRRAIQAAYAAATGDRLADVRDIAQRARAGELAARSVLRTALRGLGAAMSPYLERFQADVLVMGGSMAASWELFEPWFRDGCAGRLLPRIEVAADAEAAGLIGAGWFSRRRSESADDRPD